MIKCELFDDEKKRSLCYSRIDELFARKCCFQRLEIRIPTREEKISDCLCITEASVYTFSIKRESVSAG